MNEPVEKANETTHEKECPVCGVMLDYVFVFDKARVEYWCHCCDYTAIYKLQEA